MINRERDFMMWVLGFTSDKVSLNVEQLNTLTKTMKEVFRAIHEDNQRNLNDKT